MGTKQDAVCLRGQITGDNIRALQLGAVEARQCCLLLGNGHSVLLELRDYPLTTLFVGLAVHRTRTEVTLLLTELEGTVGNKGWSYWLHTHRIVTRSLLAKPARDQCGDECCRTDCLQKTSHTFCTCFITRRKLPPQIFWISCSL